MPGPNPTNFTNFNRYFSANKDAAQNSANQYSQQAQNSIDRSQVALNGAKSDFEQQSNAAAYTPQSNVGTGGLDQHSIDLLNGKTPAQAAPQTNVGTGAPTSNNTGYSGPGSITDVSSFQNAANSAERAGQQVQGLGLVGMGGLDANGNARGDLSTLVQQKNPYSSPGANQLSANLIGSAGRVQFDKLANYFDPNKAINQAITDTTAEGATNQSQYDAALAADAAAAQRQSQLGAAGSAVQGNTSGAGLSTVHDSNGIPDSFTGTAAQARSAGYTDQQIADKYGYAALAQLEKDNGNLS